MNAIYESAGGPLAVTREQAALYAALFANRGEYLQQSHYPGKQSGKFYYFQARDRATKVPIKLQLSTIQAHLAGQITIGLYAISPDTQSSKWIAIDADYTDARKDLDKLQEAFRADGIEALMESSRRGGHLWIFLDEPILSQLCRFYVLNIALRLGVPLKKEPVDGIEVFPRQDRLEEGDFGNAIRGPLGIHRASRKRYWFEDAPMTLADQFALLNQAKKVTIEHLVKISIDLPPLPEPPKPKEWVPPAGWGTDKRGFQILDHVKVEGRSGKDYVAQCPSCAQIGADNKRHHLAISVDQPQMYHCWTGCTKEQIRAALGHPISNLARLSRVA